MKEEVMLASQSPRRREYMALLGVPYRCQSPQVDETRCNVRRPDRRCVALARQKAMAVADDYPQAWCIGADTLVVVDDEILGKPRDEADAYGMLQRIQGRSHLVYTGVCLYRKKTDEQLCGYRRTRVWFAPMSAQQIRAYIRTGEPMDKAGAYGIQGRAAAYIQKIEGCYFNVVGLPVQLLAELCKQAGVL